MKRFLILFLAIALCAVVFSFASCAGDQAPVQADVTTASAADATITTEAPAQPDAPCDHMYKEISYTDALALKDGEIVYACKMCGFEDIETIPATKSLKVLAIGNSFSVDATQYLWGICKNAGVTDVVVGSLYIGGCSLDKHMSKINSGEAAYTYDKNTKGSFVKTEEVCIDDALLDEEWDFITIQQVSQYSGKQSTFKNLDAILDYISEKCPNAKIIWHMTWAYQQDSTHSGFANYYNDQTIMYESIAYTTQDIVEPNPKISGIIPAGTTIQNMRTSVIGDTLTRDGYHLKLDLGRYAASVTWYAYLTGGPVDKAVWYPSKAEYKDAIEENYHIISECVANALETPYAVTESQYK